MQASLIQIIAFIFTFIFFGAIGFQLSKKFKRPVSVFTWIALIIGAFLAHFMMRSALLIGIFEFKIFVNDSLHALCIGIIAGLVTREIRMKVTTH